MPTVRISMSLGASSSRCFTSALRLAFKARLRAHADGMHQHAPRRQQLSLLHHSAPPRLLGPAPRSRRRQAPARPSAPAALAAPPSRSVSPHRPSPSRFDLAQGARTALATSPPSGRRSPLSSRTRAQSRHRPRRAATRAAASALAADRPDPQAVRDLHPESSVHADTAPSGRLLCATCFLPRRSPVASPHVGRPLGHQVGHEPSYYIHQCAYAATAAPRGR